VLPGRFLACCTAVKAQCSQRNHCRGGLQGRVVCSEEIAMNSWRLSCGLQALCMRSRSCRTPRAPGIFRGRLAHFGGSRFTSAGARNTGRGCWSFQGVLGSPPRARGTPSDGPIPSEAPVQLVYIKVYRPIKDLHTALTPVLNPMFFEHYGPRPRSGTAPVGKPNKRLNVLSHKSMPQKQKGIRRDMMLDHRREHIGNAR
jgi:hypothetical protein